MDFVAILIARAWVALFAVEVVAITYLAKKADDWRTRRFDDDDLIVREGNVAVAVRRAGLYLGGMIAMAGVLSGPSHGVWRDLLAVAVFGIAAYAVLLLARWLCHELILGGIDDDDECRRGNVAVGLVEAGIFVATGVILNGTLAGESASLLKGLRDFLIFFALGQLVLVAVAMAFRALAHHAGRGEVERDNRAVGIELAGIFVATALVLRASLGGPSRGLGNDVVGFLVSAALGVALLFAFQYALRVAFLPGADVSRRLREGNLAVAFTVQALTIAFALVLATLAG